MFSAATKTDNVSSAANYIEDVFSTYLYTGNGSTGQTISNGIDLSTKGGMVWAKSRSNAQTGFIFDTNRGNGKYIIPSETNSEANGAPNGVTFLTNGFSVQDGVAPTFSNLCNQSGYTYVSWAFRKQAKFFDVVTYTGDGNTSKTVSHSLGSVPGMMIIKSTTSARDWAVYYGDNTKYLVLNLTNAAATTTTIWNDTSPTSTQFTVGNNSRVNESGQTYVAYLFANNAGGFGPSGTDNVISCGSFTTSAGGTATVTLNYEPQFVILKDTGASGEDWILLDTMRGWANGSNDALLRPNLSSAETSAARGNPISTGFDAAGLSGSSTYIYIAIRRGPMKTPTSGTSVFAPTIWTGNTPNVLDTRSISGFGKPTDLFIGSDRDTTFNHNLVYDRLRGTDTTGGKLLYTHNTSDEATNANSGSYSFAQMDGITLGNYVINYSGRLDVGWFFGRAPGFFDVVCYTGTGSSRVLNHNLGVTPELFIVKGRSNAFNWIVVPYGYLTNSAFFLNTTDSLNAGQGTIPTASSTTFTVDNGYQTMNAGGTTYVAYLFASVAGVSKVGSYTGTGALQTINCGFAAGARFVLIKRTDSTGDWWVYDSARGITSGNDPYLFLNSTAAEVTNTNYVDTASTGFQVTAAAPAGLNANGGTYIFLAIA